MHPFLKTKKFYIGVPILVIVALWSFGKYRAANQPPVYETVQVERGPLVQTVEATGKIESVNGLALRFETAGTLDKVNVAEGDTVKAGQLLANLRAYELNAAVAQASANLNQRIAGASDSEREYYRAAADAAQADWEKSKADAANSVASYKAALDTAQNNLKLAEGGENSQIVNDAYADAVALLHATISKLDNALTQADNILGVDNDLANDSFETALSVLDPNKLSAAESQYLVAKTAKDNLRTAAVNLTTASAHEPVDSALISAEEACAKMSVLLLDVADVLNASLPTGALPQTTLDSYKTTIETTRTAVTTQYTSVIAQKQSIADAKNSYITYSIAYEKALNDYTNAQTTAAASIAIKEAAYKQALANLENKTLPTREVDLAPLRAALAAAVANRDKAYIRAPIDGVVAKVHKKVGELVSVADVAIEMISPHYEVTVDIPETDVPKLQVGNTTTITLDAFGEDKKFYGQVVTIDPASTEVQDVVYYKVTVALNDSEDNAKPGMTANVTFDTAYRDDALYVPLRTVRTNEDGKYLRVLANGQVEERPITLGLKADDGKAEILAGVEEGEEIVVAIKENQ